MPSLAHEAWLLLFRNRPSLAAELLQDALGVLLPEHQEARVESAELSELAPTEYRADLVIALRRSGEERPVAAVVLEAQLRPDEDKRYSWPAYLMTLRARWRCPVCLLVVTPEPGVVRWCRRPIELGPPGLCFTPLVLGPDAIPEVRDPERAERAPELAVLSAMAHGKSETGAAQEVALAAIAAAAGLPKERAMLYLDLVMASLSEAAKRAVEALVSSTAYTYQSDFAKRYYNQGRDKGLAEGREEGLERGREEGLERGREEGLERGRDLGEAQALLVVLEGRGMIPDERQRERILGAGREELGGWLRRAATAASLEELLDS